MLTEKIVMVTYQLAVREEFADIVIEELHRLAAEHSVHSFGSTKRRLTKDEFEEAVADYEGGHGTAEFRR